MFKKKHTLESTPSGDVYSYILRTILRRTTVGCGNASATFGVPTTRPVTRSRPLSDIASRAITAWPTTNARLTFAACWQLVMAVSASSRPLVSSEDTRGQSRALICWNRRMVLPLAGPITVAKNNAATRTGVQLGPSTASWALRLRTRTTLFDAAVILLSVDRASRTLKAVGTPLDVSEVRTAFVAGTTVRSRHEGTSYTAIHGARRAWLVRKDGSKVWLLLPSPNDRTAVVVVLQRCINAMPHPSVFSWIANGRRGPSSALCAGGILAICRAGHGIRPSSRPIP